MTLVPHPVEPLIQLARNARRHTRLDARRQSELEFDLRRVISALSQAANESLTQTVRGVERYRDMKALHRALLVAFVNTPHELAVKSAKPGDICGAWDAARGAVMIDGGKHYGARLGGLGLPSGYFLAHELGEALDAAGAWSSRAEWVNAWRKEMLDHPELNAWAQEADWRRHRAQESPHEGFCEFLALATTVWHGKSETLERMFPQCYAFWRENGLFAEREKLEVVP